ncbi:MAG: type II secretion system GspH family protein [Armatimonadetes bacterium]|nr:type II secretion system GspH family protein [Armatimonadota bacterium]
MTKGARAAFTLIELLVVIGIIAILAAVLAPVYISAKHEAQSNTCKSNLLQISKAFETYAGDYEGSYPNTNNQYLWSGYYWREPIRKYVALGAVSSNGTRNMVLACPADPTPPGIYAGTSYAYSASFYMTPEQVNSVADGNYLRSKFAASNPKLPCSTVKSSSVRFGSKKALVAEYWTLHSKRSKVGWYDEPETGNDAWSGERNYLFADGHVVYLATSRIHPADSPLVSRPRSLPDINLTTDGVAGRDVD